MSAAFPRTAFARRRMFPFPGALFAKRRVRLVMTTLLVLLIAVLATGFIATVNLYRSAEDRYVRVALPLRTLTRDVLFRLTEEETAVRGYMITTNRRSLDPYFEGRDALAADLAEIRRLTRHRPQLAARTHTMAAEAQSLRGFYDRLITFVADGRLGQAQARQEVLNPAGEPKRISRTAAAMQDDIDAFIAQTRNAQRATYYTSLAILAFAGFFGIAVAVSLLLRVPEQLGRAYAEQEEGAQASRALEHVSEAVFLVDDDERIRSWNPAAAQLFGIDAEHALGQPARAIVVDYDELVEAADHGDPFVPVMIDAAERWLAPVVSEFEGGSVVAVRDATAGYTLERARTDFVATASHELRTPLTAVYGGATTLLARGDDLTMTQRTRLLRMIADEAEHLTRIVDQLLVSAQLDRGTLRVTESECDVAALCTIVATAARARAPEGVTVAVQVPSAVAPVRCDESLLRQVLDNLVDNAVKYSVDGGLVLVRLQDETAAVHVDVVDKGLGIPAAEQERIFEKFFRLDAEMTRGVGGSGLGLYISREIVTQLGGTLSVRSQAGRGSTFTVSLPRRG
jgi:signal transduction histidine kinase